MNNKRLGNRFEDDLCKRLFAHGFWAHNLAQNQSGQPADILAVRNKHAYLIDCKVCSGDKFLLTRMEENQDLSMKLWKECGNGEGWFALLIQQMIWMIPYTAIIRLRNQISYIKLNDLVMNGKRFDEWVDTCR